MSARFRYLWLFCGALTADGGEKFHLVEAANDIIWREVTPESLRRETERHLIPHRVVHRTGEGADASWWIEALVVFKDSMFEALFQVDGDGKVWMVEDSPRAADLPVATFMRARAASAG